ncbi:hypothetical protein BAR24066_01555 [Burkholderia arboris]|uniref:Lipoprotein n=1 Tax=Burkholderia arboris TaxID=488730 RepID=A0A9Q9SFF4_9BURK|nr:hypothetical protein [Burkholderia arboris]VWB35649.1 hypothetical protein BAR24066_01555 [Burkholderia arboris]
MSRQIRMTFRTMGIAMSVVGALAGCVVGPTNSSYPQPQLVAAQKDANARYTQTLTSFIAFASNAKSDSRARILEAYQGVLYQYSLAAVSYVQLVYPSMQALPPALQPLPAPAGTPTIADVDRDYEHMLGMKVAMWDIGTAALWGKTSKMSIPRYRGAISPSMPVTPPLPPFQDARDPKYARLVAMTKQVEDAQTAEFEQKRQADSREIARAINAPKGSSYSAPQQQQGVQRWCTQSGGGVIGRVPC